MTKDISCSKIIYISVLYGCIMAECEMCNDKNEEHLTSVGDKILCFGCEHEILYKDRDYEIMQILYGDY